MKESFLGLSMVGMLLWSILLTVIKKGDVQVLGLLLFLAILFTATANALKQGKMFPVFGYGNLILGFLMFGLQYCCNQLPEKAVFYLCPEKFSSLQFGAICSVFLGILTTAFYQIYDIFHRRKEYKGASVKYYNSVFKCGLITILLTTGFVGIGGWMSVLPLSQNSWMTSGFFSIGAVFAYIIYLLLVADKGYQQCIEKNDKEVAVYGYLLTLFGGAFVASFLMVGYLGYGILAIPISMLSIMWCLSCMVRIKKNPYLFILLGSMFLSMAVNLLNIWLPIEPELMRATNVFLCIAMVLSGLGYGFFHLVLLNLGSSSEIDDTAEDSYSMKKQ